jgi:hypothetical protein
MVQWWELTIPAASTLLGAWSGYWWQSRSTEKQLERQAREADEARQFAAHREDLARWFGERRTAYADLGRTSHAFMLAAYIYWSAEASFREGAMRTREEEDLSELEADRDKAVADFNTAGDTMRDAMVSVQIVGSERQAEVAQELDAEMEKMVREAPRSYDQFVAVRDRFLSHARAELSET